MEEYFSSVDQPQWARQTMASMSVSFWSMRFRMRVVSALTSRKSNPLSLSGEARLEVSGEIIPKMAILWPPTVSTM